MSASRDPFAELFGPLRGAPRAPDAKPRRPPSRRREPGGSVSGLRYQGIGQRDVVDALRTCAATIGQAPTQAEYEKWRASRACAGAGRLAPSLSIVASRFGCWSAAVAAALE